MKVKQNPYSIGLLTGVTLVAGAGANGAANAATISVSSGFSTSDSLMLTDDGFSSPTTGQSTEDQIIQLNQFDPVLGTLTGVDFNLTSSLGETTGLSLDVLPQEEGSDGSATADFVLSITDSVTGSLLGTTFMHSTLCSGVDDCSNSDTSHADATYDDTTNVSPLAGYQGLGTYQVTVTQMIDLSVTSAGGSDSGDADATFAGQWSGQVQAVYTFDEVVIPVPAAVWLFGSGLLALVGVARRKV